jgi:hypothetical protein
MTRESYPSTGQDPTPSPGRPHLNEDPRAGQTAFDGIAGRSYAGRPRAGSILESSVGLTVQPDQRGQRVPTSVESLVREGALDAELAALLSILVEARVPLIVAGEVDPAARTALLDALLESLPAGTRGIPLAGVTEDFGWLPEAGSLGWRPDGPTPGRGTPDPATPDATVILAGDLTRDELGATWAGVVRIAARAVSLGYGLAGTIAADSLEAVFARLGAAPFRITDDELSRLGVVVVLASGEGAVPRIAAAHYVRPVARDMHGHLQRLGPAVLATSDRDGRFEHFAWGVTPELALRTGRRAGDFEIEQDRRREELTAAPQDMPAGGPP